MAALPAVSYGTTWPGADGQATMPGQGEEGSAQRQASTSPGVVILARLCSSQSLTAVRTGGRTSPQPGPGQIITNFMFQISSE